jgi:hypothetical protein
MLPTPFSNTPSSENLNFKRSYELNMIAAPSCLFLSSISLIFDALPNINHAVVDVLGWGLQVKCVHNEELGPGVFDREVDLLVRLGDQPGDAVRFCTARYCFFFSP